MPTSNLCNNLWTIRDRDFLFGKHVFSYNTKVNDFVAAERIVFYKHILLWKNFQTKDQKPNYFALITRMTYRIKLADVVVLVVAVVNPPFVSAVLAHGHTVPVARSSGEGLLPEPVPPFTLFISSLPDEDLVEEYVIQTYPDFVVDCGINIKC